jgi:pseudomonalisin
MIRLRPWERVTSCASVLLLSCVLAGGLSAQVRPRIVQTIDERALVRLSGSVHPRVSGASDIGRVAANLPMERVLLHLSASAEQEAALEQLLAAQQDPSAPDYHQWLTPQEFGDRFGVAQQDLDAISAWLAGQGLQVTGVSPNRRTLEFSGTASQVEQAFHTEIHELLAGGERHIANTTELSIPVALRPVVEGPVSLHNFARQPFHRVLGPAPTASGRGRTPATNLVGGSHSLSPYDFAAIYDVAPLWNNNFDGTRQTIGIAGRTDIKLSDVASFRSQFGLPANVPQIIVNGRDPGIVSFSEETEADLDVEWAGAVAKGANIALVVSASTSSTDGVDLSNVYLVNNNIAGVISVSFGACEAAMGSAGNAFYNSLWQQAAAQGISVFVAAGDSGSAGCDPPTPGPAIRGFAVSGLASTPYNVAVGGSEFSDANASLYWNTSNNSHYASAIGYIPEVVWNESSYTTRGASSNGLWSGAGGVSIVYPTPSWQSAPGVPAADPGTTTGHHRYLPDVSLSAAGHDGYLIFQEGGLYLVGGTSASSPSFAGILAVIDQYAGGRSGNPNAKLYPIATRVPSVYHDIVSGNNEVPCTVGSPNCTASSSSTIGVMNGYVAGVGYDLATGLGSVDAYELALNWGSASTTGGGPVITSLNPNPMTASASAQILTVTGSGFVSGTGLAVELISGATTVTYTGAAIRSVSATQIQVSINSGTATQNWTVEVVNPNGKASTGVTLQVVAPAAPPTITSLSPNPMAASGAIQPLLITGTGFQAGASAWKVLLTYPGLATAMQATPVTVLSSTQIQAMVNLGTTVRTWSVQVVNPSGVASNTASLQMASVKVPPPAIQSLSPSLMAPSRPNVFQPLTISGTGFQAGATVTLTSASATVVAAGGQLNVANSYVITLPVSLGSTPQAWTVTVKNPDGQVSNSVMLIVY